MTIQFQRPGPMLAGCLCVLIFASIAAADTPATQPDQAAAPATQPDLPPFQPHLSAKRTGKTLAYDLYQPELPAGTKTGMVVWLHGAGAAGNEKVIAEYKQPLLEAGVALLIPHTADPAQWKPNDTGRLLDTLQAVANASGRIDASRSVLLGFSAGGQLAFAVARARPKAIAGVVAMGAYPIVNTQRGQQLWVPPKGQENHVRYFFLVGDQDNGRLVLRRVETVWKARKVDVTLLEVPELGHAYAADQQKVLTPWMAAVAKGKDPSDPLAEQHQAELEARKATAVAFLTELKRLGDEHARAATQPDAADDAPPADAKTDKVGPFTFHLPADWSQVREAAGGQPAVWRLNAKGNAGAEQPPLANLALSEFQVPIDFSAYLSQRYAQEMLKGKYTTIHGRGKTALVGRAAVMIMLSEQPVIREPGAVDLKEVTDYRLELFMQVDRGGQYLGLAYQWRQGDGPEPKQAAAQLFEILRLMEGDPPPATQPEQGDQPPADLPLDLLG